MILALDKTDLDAVYSNPDFIHSLAIVTNIYQSTAMNVISPYDGPSFTALWNDPQPDHQVALFEAIFGTTSRLIVPFTENSRSDAQTTLLTANRLGLVAQSIEIDSTADLLRMIADAPINSVMLMLPDPELYDRTTLPAVIRTAYEYDVPLMGFSPDIVSAGATATTFPSLVDRVDFIQEALSDVLDDIATAPRSSRPIQFQINQQIARSLGITVPNDVADRLEDIRLAIEEASDD